MIKNSKPTLSKTETAGYNDPGKTIHSENVLAKGKEIVQPRITNDMTRVQFTRQNKSKIK